MVLDEFKNPHQFLGCRSARIDIWLLFIYTYGSIYPGLLALTLRRIATGVSDLVTCLFCPQERPCERSWCPPVASSRDLRLCTDREKQRPHARPKRTRNGINLVRN